jgi:type IV fimbrial biogenesis protein FimT
MTLIEAMIALVIFGLLVILGLPAMRGSLNNYRVRAATEAVMNGLNIARATAVQRNGNAEFILGPGASWVVQLPLVNGGTVVKQYSADDGAADVVVAVLPDPSTTMTFNGRGGIAGNADGSACLYQAVFSLPGVTHPLRLDVSISGAVRMCDTSIIESTDNRFCSDIPHC